MVSPVRCPDSRTSHLLDMVMALPCPLLAADEACAAGFSGRLRGCAASGTSGHGAAFGSAPRRRRACSAAPSGCRAMDARYEAGQVSAHDRPGGDLQSAAKLRLHSLISRVQGYAPEASAQCLSPCTWCSWRRSLLVPGHPLFSGSEVLACCHLEQLDNDRNTAKSFSRLSAALHAGRTWQAASARSAFVRFLLGAHQGWGAGDARGHTAVGASRVEDSFVPPVRGRHLRGRAPRLLAVREQPFWCVLPLYPFVAGLGCVPGAFSMI